MEQKRFKRIAVNTRLLIHDSLDGIGWFTHEILRRIVLEHQDVEFYFLFDRKYDPRFIYSENIKPVVLPPQSRHPVLWYLWFEHSVRRYLNKEKFDLFFSPDGYLPTKTSTKTLAAIHDINFIHRPHDLPIITRKYLSYYFPRFAASSNRIITVSEYSKKDIVDSFNIDASKVDVVYNGCHDKYGPLSEEEKLVVKEDYFEGNEYFVFIGTLLPRKNAIGLIKAFDMFISKSQKPFRLAIVGSKKFGMTEFNAALEKLEHKEKIKLLGRLEPADLHKVLAASFSLILPSFFEGFGIPIVEAMNCDVPVITSNTTSMPEVCGDAGILVDPFSVDSIARGIEQMASDPDFRLKLIEKGKVQREKFTWDSAAKSAWESILNTMNS